MVDIESFLFSQLTKNKSLPHPTARNFDRQKWIDAAAAGDTLSPRDKRLLAAALHFGNEIQSLRQTFEARLFESLAQRTAILLSIAMANHNYIVLRKRAAESVSNAIRRKGGAVAPDRIARQPFAGAYPGSMSDADGAVTAIVDTIPHCIERAIRRPLHGQTPKDFWTHGSTLFAILSLEHSLRDIWQSVLWDGWELAVDDGIPTVRPTDIELATLWKVWIWRQEMVLTQSTTLDSLQQRMSDSGELVRPFHDLSVVGIGGGSKPERRFRFGSLSGRERGQIWHAVEDQALTASYLAPFIDTPLPNLKVDLSCRTLQRAWYVIRECANILASKCKERGLPDIDALERYALLIRRSEIERAVSSCVKLSPEQAKAAIDFLICDLTDNSSLFTKGLWAFPIILIDGGENCLLTLASILVGSPIRRIESWLDKGGLSDRLATARRGLRYEAWVRKELRYWISENSLLPNSRCAIESTVRRNDTDEQIDLLVRLGNLLIVGEVKCLLGPVESMEHFNYLSKLNEAGKQAVRKANWIASNRDVAAQSLELPLEEVQRLRPVPVVVLNQGSGVSLLAEGARVVDFHFLRLYLKDGSYTAGAAFNFADKLEAAHLNMLYGSEEEAAGRFEQVMAKPPTITRFASLAQWGTTLLPMSTGKNMKIAICSIGDEDDAAARHLVSAVS